MKIIKYSDVIVSKECNEFIIDVLSKQQENYPKIEYWFYNKVVPNIGGDREIILLEYKKQVIALLILKYSEKKISTMYVHPDFRHKGFGKLLIKISKRELNTPKPKITISESVFQFYENLLNMSGFKLTGVLKDVYKEGIREFYYNYKEEDLNGNKP